MDTARHNPLLKFGMCAGAGAKIQTKALCHIPSCISFLPLCTRDTNFPVVSYVLPIVVICGKITADDTLPM